jgi:hypothetical protein
MGNRPACGWTGCYGKYGGQALNRELQQCFPHNHTQCSHADVCDSGRKELGMGILPGYPVMEAYASGLAGDRPGLSLYGSAYR